jgi:hypothetical protein
MDIVHGQHVVQYLGWGGGGWRGGKGGGGGLHHVWFTILVQDIID